MTKESHNLVFADAIRTAIKISKENVRLKRWLKISIAVNVVLAVIIGGLLCV